MPRGAEHCTWLRIGFKEGWSQKRASAQQKRHRQLLKRLSPRPEAGVLVGTWRGGDSVHCRRDCGSARPPRTPARRVLGNYEDSCQGPGQATLGARPTETEMRIRRSAWRVHRGASHDSQGTEPPGLLSLGEDGAEGNAAPRALGAGPSARRGAAARAAVPCGLSSRSRSRGDAAEVARRQLEEEYAPKA